MYPQQLQSLVDRTAPEGEIGRSIVCKHFFSGAAAYYGDRIFMTLTPVGLAFKLPERTCSELFRRGFEPLQYFPGGHIKKGYALLSSWNDHDQDDLCVLIRRSIEYAGSCHFS